MLPNKTRHLLYAVLLMAISAICTSAIAKTSVYGMLTEVASDFEATWHSMDLSPDGPKKEDTSHKEYYAPKTEKVSTTASPLMFMTIIQGADEEVICPDDGSTLARFNLCGDFDDRTITVQGSHSNYVWQRLSPGTGCNIDSNCPQSDTSPGSCTGTWTTIDSDSQFDLDPTSISASTGAEFRVSVSAGGGAPFYYFKVKKSSITLNSDFRDFICGVPGRIQLLGLSSAYEYSIDGGTTWQSSSVFTGLLPGDYDIVTRLQGTPGACEYPYDTITITEQVIDIGVTVNDVVCFGQNGSLDVMVNNVPGPYRYTLLDDSGNVQEFTSFIGSNTHTFGAVASGTYTVQVETPQCSGDASLGVPPPQESMDTSGNPITIGSGITQITATAEHTQSLSAACGVNNVDITLSVGGGAGPYTYTVSGDATVYGPITGSDTYTVSTAQTYEFTVIDANGCQVTTSDPVAEITPPDVTVSGIDGTCTNGGARLEFNVTDAKGYTLSFRADSADSWSPSSSLSVAAGTYNDIQVRYQLGANDCILQLTPPQPAITVTNDNGVSATAVKIQDQVCLAAGGTEGGIIEVQSPTGGSGSYQYSIDGVNFVSTNRFSGLSPGAYTASIRDTTNPGCVRDLTTITIDAVSPPTNIDFAVGNIDCSTGTLDVTLTGTASAAISTYQIISPSAVSNSTGVFTGLVSGTTYTFRITDANNCSYEESYIPVVDSSVRARVKSGGDRRVCPSIADGTGAFLLDGFLSDTPGTDYDYVVIYTPLVGASSTFTSGSSSDAEIGITGLGAGNYEITITDNDTNCTDTADFDVEEASTALSVTASVTDMSCQNNNRGRVRADAAGGFAGYRYRLDGPAGFTTQGPRTGRFFGNLSVAGSYTLTVIDSEGCEATDTFTLSEVDPPAIALGPVDYCYGPGDDASIAVTSTAGTADISTHRYRINGGALQTSPIFSGLFPGFYTVEVVDGSLCTDAVRVRIPPQVQVSLSIVSEIPCGGDGEMEIRVTGGDISDLSTVSYDVLYNDGSGTVTVESGTSIPSNPFSYTVPLLSPGDYSVMITDNNGCPRTSATVTFEAPTSILAGHRIVGPSCLDPNSGLVEVIPDVSSGVPPFEVVFAPAPSPGVLTDNAGNPNAGATTFAFSDQTIYSGLSAGFYEYVVKDARNCVTAVTRIEVVPDGTPPPNTTVAPIDATCNDATDVVSGGITITTAPTGGVAEFTFIIEDLFGNEITRMTTDGSTTYPLDIIHPDITSGNYRVITLDARGCNDIDDIAVGNDIVDLVPDNTTLPSMCVGPAGFTYCIDIVGGTGPFDVRIVENPAGTFTPLDPATPRRHCFPNTLLGETFVVEVRDNATGCIYEEVITVPDRSFDLDVDLTIGNGTCIPGDLVELTYTIVGATGNLDIQILNLNTGDVINDSRTDATYTYHVEQGEYAIVIVDDGTNCSGGDVAVATLDIPRVDVIENINANCNAQGQITVRGSGGTPFSPGALTNDSRYEYAFVDAGSAPGPGDYGVETTISLDGSLTGRTHIS